MVPLSSESSSSAFHTPQLNTYKVTGSSQAGCLVNLMNSKSAPCISVIFSTWSAVCQIVALILLAIYCYRLVVQDSDEYSFVWLCISVSCCALSAFAGVVVLFAAGVLRVRRQKPTAPKAGWFVIIIGTLIAFVLGN